MKRKILIILTTLFTALVLVACKQSAITVTFNSNGGTAVEKQEVVKGEVALSPDEPTLSNKVFAGWYEEEDLSGEPYSFTIVVEKSLTLHAKWIDSNSQHIKFVDHRLNTSYANLANSNGVVAKPKDPVKEGFRFGGWFTTSRGLVWNDTEAYDFTKAVPDGGITLYTYWEPLNSKTHNWSDGETYFSTLSSTVAYTLNPLNYEYVDELSIVQSMATALYFQEVDWDQAIQDGYADFEGDFSKFGTGDGQYGIDLLKNHYVLGGAASFPKDKNGHDLVDDATGKWDRDAAAQFRDTVWTIDLRTDLQFENGDKITASDYVYTYFQYIDPVQNNKRGGTLFPAQDRKNGYSIVNSRAYFLTPANGELFQYEVDKGLFTGEIVDGMVTKDSVGFKAIGEHTIQLTFEEPVAQTSAVGLMNSIWLVHEATYEASLDAARENSSYGTVQYPYVSYGGYIIKSWDHNQKIVFNKNYDYVLKEIINYKSMSYQYTDGVDTNMELFKENKLSAVGLSGDYAAEYAEWENNYPTYNGYPASFEVNVTDALDGTRPAHEALKDINFRNALLFGFDRQEFTNTVYAPNAPSIMIWPIQAKQFNSDEFWYKDTQDHKDVLAALGINEDTDGFDQAKAIQYFNLAYDAWVAKGNTGPIQLNYVVRNADLHIRIANYIEQHFEQLFGTDKLDIKQEILDSTVLFARTDNRSFDIAFDTSGWGFADSAFVYMPLKGLYYTWLFGEDAGMNLLSAFDGLEDAMFHKQIDLRNTYQHLLSTKYEAEGDEETPSGFWDDETAQGTTKLFFEHLHANEGYFVGKAIDLFAWLVNDDFIFVTEGEPFAGATADLTRVTAGYEYLILEYVTLIPVASSTSVVAYAQNVKIEWPEYSYELGWGTARYRHLTTDPDFAQ